MTLNIAWLILWIPFFTFLFIALLSRWPRITGWLATSAMGVCFVLSISLHSLGANQLGSDPSGSDPFWGFQSSFIWLRVFNTPVEFGILLNPLTVLMLLIVTGIGSLIFLYSIGYMKHEKGQGRYFAFLTLFSFSMLGIVLSNNLIQTFIFWELVGLSSYLLIGFWFEREEAATAGKKAFLTTRVGDIGMMIGILMLFSHTGTFNFGEIKNIVGAGFSRPELGAVTAPLQAIPSHIMTAICLMLFMGIAGKSAQIPLHVWLPDAMEGPTPVSALIHAATMVAAGVFLLARLDFLFSMSTDAMAVIALIGAATMLLNGALAFFQNDIKKILAYSTLSQLGFMVLGMGLGESQNSMLHLTTHAFFKALLFLAAGSFIHACHTQDIDAISAKAGGFKNFGKLPFTKLGFLIGCATMIGIPPMTSLISKDLILETILHKSPLPEILTMTLFLLPTYFYTIRMLIKISLPKNSSPASLHEEGMMVIPLIFLSLFCFEFIFKSFFSSFFNFPRELHIPITHGGILLAALICYFIFRGRYSKIPFVFQKKLFFDALYSALIRTVQEGIATSSDWIERKVIVEGAANGTGRLVLGIAARLRRLQTGIVQSYVLFFVIGLVLLILFFVSSPGLPPQGLSRSL